MNVLCRALLCVVSISSAAIAEDKNADPNISPERTITVPTEGGKEKGVRIPKGVYLAKNGELTLRPGDQVHLEFESVDGKLSNPKVVAGVTHKDRTITFSMKTDANITILTRDTGIQKTVAMDCEHRSVSSRKFFRTNLRPTEKGIGSFDSWPNGVYELKLFNIEVTDKSASEVYEKKVSK